MLYFVRVSWILAGIFVGIGAFPAAAEGPLITRPGTPLPPAKEGFAYPDCFCTDSTGGRVEVGERACLTINRRQMSAICGMSLNNPAWRMEGEGCGMS